MVCTVFLALTDIKGLACATAPVLQDSSRAPGLIVGPTAQRLHQRYMQTPLRTGKSPLNCHRQPGVRAWFRRGSRLPGGDPGSSATGECTLGARGWLFVWGGWGERASERSWRRRARPLRHPHPQRGDWYCRTRHEDCCRILAGKRQSHTSRL